MIAKRSLWSVTAILIALLAGVTAAACSGASSPTAAPREERPTPTPYSPPPTATPINTPELSQEEAGTETPTPEERPTAEAIPTAMAEFQPTATLVPTSTPAPQRPTTVPTPLPPGQEATLAASQRLSQCLQDNELARNLARLEVSELLEQQEDESLLGRVSEDLEAEKARGLWVSEYLIRYVTRWNEETDQSANSWIHICEQAQRAG